MNKWKIIIKSVIVIILLLIISVYLAIGLFYDVPGTNGFGYMHAVIGIIISGKDTIKVNDNFYVYKQGELINIIKSEFDVLKDTGNFGEGYKQLDIDSVCDEDLNHAPIVEKDGIEYTVHINTTLSNIFPGKYYKVYFAPK